MVSRNLDVVLQKGRYSVDCFKIRNENGNILFTSPWFLRLMEAIQDLAIVSRF